MTKINTATNRQQRKYSNSILIKRILWAIITPFFRFSPRIFFTWRCFLLRLFGASIGKQVHIYNSALIYFPWQLKIGDWSAIGEDAFIYNLGSVTIGDNVTISQRAYLCAGTHDYTDPSFPLIQLPIKINDKAWICTDVFVGPNVIVGEGAVVGARTVVVKNVAPWTVVAGNPMKTIKKRILKN